MSQIYLLIVKSLREKLRFDKPFYQNYYTNVYTLRINWPSTNFTKLKK